MLGYIFLLVLPGLLQLQGDNLFYIVRFFSIVWRMEDIIEGGIL